MTNTKTIVKTISDMINGCSSSSTLLKNLTNMQYYSLYLMNESILENPPKIMKI